MALIQPDRFEESGAPVRQMYARQAQTFGYLPNYAELFSHRPDILESWASLQKGLRQHVSVRMFELVTFAAAVALKSSYCTLAHGVRLRAFFTDAEIASLARGEFAGIVSDREAAAMSYAAQISLDANGVEAPHIAGLRTLGCSDAEVFDIAAIAAGRAFFVKLVEGLGALPDNAYQDLPAPLRQALTLGRPIASA